MSIATTANFTKNKGEVFFMDIKYLLTKDSIENENGDRYIGYGIEITVDGVSVRRIADIYTDEATARAFVSRCNRLHLSPLHIDDVIEDEI